MVSATLKWQTGRTQIVALDLRDEWKDRLIQAGFKTNERTLWLIEGLLIILEETQVVTLFDRINSLASSKDIMLSDILSRSLLEASYMLNQFDFLKNI